MVTSDWQEQRAFPLFTSCLLLLTTHHSQFTVLASQPCYFLNQRPDSLPPEKPMTATQLEKAQTFRRLHQGPRAFVFPNPWDIVSARMLASLGFQALATSSGAMAATYGRRDGHVTRDMAL